MLSTTNLWSSSDASPGTVTAATTQGGCGLATDPILLVGSGSGQDATEEDEVMPPDVYSNSVALGNSLRGHARPQLRGVLVVKSLEDQFFLVPAEFAKPA
jgi:hypothetical protein